MSEADVDAVVARLASYTKTPFIVSEPRDQPVETPTRAPTRTSSSELDVPSSTSDDVLDSDDAIDAYESVLARLRRTTKSPFIEGGA